jgi:hypothetical protein
MFKDLKQMLNGNTMKMLTIIIKYFEWFPIRVSSMMGLPAGIGRVAVIVANVLNQFEVCLQNFDKFFNEGGRWTPEAGPPEG